MFAFAAQQASVSLQSHKELECHKVGTSGIKTIIGGLYTASYSQLLYPFVSAVKDGNKFSFGGNGKVMFGQTGEEPFSLTPKSNSPSLGTGSPTVAASTSSEAPKQTSTTTAFRLEPQPPKTIGGETLGSFSGLRVGQGEEAKDSSAKPLATFSFGDTGLGIGKGVQQFSFGAGPQKPAEDATAASLSKATPSGSLFKPPESNSKPAFSLPPASSATSAFPTSFSSLLTASSESPEEPKAPPQPSQPTPPPKQELSTTEPAVESTSQIAAPEPAAPEPTVDAATAETTAATPTSTAPTPAAPLDTTVPTTDSPSTIVAPAEVAPPPPASAPSTVEATPEPSTTAPVTTSAAATVTPISQVAPAAFQVPNSEKPGSIFTQPAPAITDSSSLVVTPVISTAAPAATTPTPAVVNSASTTTSNNVFGQPAAPPASSAPTSTGFGSAGFGASTGTGFGKSVFGQVSGFGQPASVGGTASGFTFSQSAFGANSSSATTGGGGLFGASTASSASSFSFSTSNANTASSTGSGLFGQSTPSAFGQSSGFGQGSVFGGNTATSSSSGFSFGQPSGESDLGFHCFKFICLPLLYGLNLNYNLFHRL